MFKTIADPGRYIDKKSKMNQAKEALCPTIHRKAEALQINPLFAEAAVETVADHLFKGSDFSVVYDIDGDIIGGFSEKLASQMRHSLELDLEGKDKAKAATAKCALETLTAEDAECSNLPPMVKNMALSFRKPKRFHIAATIEMMATVEPLRQQFGCSSLTQLAMEHFEEEIKALHQAGCN